MDRRFILLGMGAVTSDLAMSACASITPIAFCPDDPLISDPRTPLTIDAHTHVFNGTDLQVSEFLQAVVAPDNEASKVLGRILQDLAWSLAPSGKAEMARLEQVSAALASCNGQTSVAEIVEADGQQQYALAVTELKRASVAASTGARGVTRGGLNAAVLREINGLPRNYSDYKRLSRGGNRPRDFAITPRGALDFVLQNFQYRYVTTFDYLKEYSAGRDRRIDLMIAHIVDYDWPLGRADGTITPFLDQFAVMERISVLTGGRIHYFAPFCPFKEAAFRLGLSGTSSLSLVRDAVRNHGALGIKLYPPMGFAPLDNASRDIPRDTWTGTPLDPRLQRADIAQLLDASLSDLYEWCRSEQIPIMAHTSPTNLAHPKYKVLLQPRWWAAVLDRYRGLRINLGHFGQTSPSESGANQAREFQLANLMTAGAATAGEYLYADSAYFADVLSQPALLRETLRTIYRSTAGKGPAALAQRLMYGTDWEMILIEGTVRKNYLSGFEAIYSDLAQDPSLGVMGALGANFFGRNASRYLGLAKGAGGSRDRIDAFYATRKIPEPLWLRKVNALPVETT